MAYLRAFCVLFGSILLIIAFVTLWTSVANANTLSAADMNNISEWHLDRWFAIRWTMKQPAHIIFELHLLPPPNLDCQAKIVFLRDRIKPPIQPRNDGSVYAISFDGEKNATTLSAVLPMLLCLNRS